MDTPKVYTLDEPSGYLEHLEEYGYAVISNVLDENTHLELIEQFWKDWTLCSPGFDRNDKSTWKIENSPMMTDVSDMPEPMKKTSPRNKTDKKRKYYDALRNKIVAF